MNIETIRLKDLKFTFLNNSYIVDGYDWPTLKDNIKSEGFLPEKYGYMTISKDGILLDGHHRHIVLKELYGENYKIKVIRKQKNYKIIVILFIIKSICILPIKLIKKMCYKKPLI